MDTKLVNAFANILDKVEAPNHNIVHDIGDRIYITELKTSGIIISIFITSMAIQYEVRYFFNGKAECVHMFEWEITKIDK